MKGAKMGNGPQFNYLDPENPYVRIRDLAKTLAKARKGAIKGAVGLFNKDGHGFKIITRIAEGEMTIVSGIRDIQNMLSAYADKNYNEFD